MKINRKGVWSMSKIPVLIFAVLLFTILYLIYAEYTQLMVFHRTLEQSRTLAYLIDSMEACSCRCTLTYMLPPGTASAPYTVDISGRTVSVAVDGVRVNTTLLNPVSGGIKLSGGEEILVIKSVQSQIELEEG